MLLQHDRQTNSLKFKNKIKFSNNAEIRLADKERLLTDNKAFVNIMQLPDNSSSVDCLVGP